MVSPTHEYDRRHDTASVCHRGDEIRGLNPRRDHMPHEHGKRCHQQCQSGAKCGTEMQVKQVLTARLLTGLSFRSKVMDDALPHSAFPLRNQLRYELSRPARDVVPPWHGSLMSARPAAKLCLSAAAVTGVVMLKQSWCMSMPTRLILNMSHTWSRGVRGRMVGGAGREEGERGAP